MATARPTLAEERRLWSSGHRWVAGLDEVGAGRLGGIGQRRGGRGVALGDGALGPGLAPGLQAPGRGPAGVGLRRGGRLVRRRGGRPRRRRRVRPLRDARRLAPGRAAGAGPARAPPDALLVDGPHDLLATPWPRTPGELRRRAPGGGPPAYPDVGLPATVVPVVGGDARCAAVAAASVLAKVVRDRRMRAEAEHFPAYGFERNKGYPSPVHKMALFGYGLSAIHRRSWSYVADSPLAGPGRSGEPKRVSRAGLRPARQGEFDLGRVGVTAMAPVLDVQRPADRVPHARRARSWRSTASPSRWTKASASASSASRAAGSRTTGFSIMRLLPEQRPRDRRERSPSTAGTSPRSTRRRCARCGATRSPSSPRTR